MQSVLTWSISSIAANRYLIKLQKNAFYCECSLVEAYSRFQSSSGKELDISFSTFYKYVGNEFKKPQRFSDLCEYCEQYKVKIPFLMKSSFVLNAKKGYIIQAYQTRNVLFSCD